MSLLPLVTNANPNQPLFAAFGSGGGGGGSTVTTSSITVSTITASGTILDYISGDPTKPAYNWSVGVDGANNSYQVLSAQSTQSAYLDVRVSESTGNPPNSVTDLRISANNGSAQIGFIPNISNPATTGLRFVSSLNTGADATGVINSTDFFPLGGQLLTNMVTVELGTGEQKPIIPPFSTITNHTYALDFQTGAEYTINNAVPNPADKRSFFVVCAGGNVANVNTRLLSELSTIGSGSPNGSSYSCVFTASGVNAQLIAQSSAGAVSSIVQPSLSGVNGVLLRDLGPQNLIIAP